MRTENIKKLRIYIKRKIQRELKLQNIKKNKINYDRNKN